MSKKTTVVQGTSRNGSPQSEFTAVTVEFTDQSIEFTGKRVARRARKWLRRHGLTVKQASRPEPHIWVFDQPLPADEDETEESEE